MLALLTATGRVNVDQRATVRAAWAQAGIDCDEIMGGLTVLGIHPAGWTLPAGAVRTLPPGGLHAPHWPTPPNRDAWVSVTENPSVIAAAALATRDPACESKIRLVCTVGNPSATEVWAIAALADASWNIAVRADFDATGIRNVTAILEAAPLAAPWRMMVRDYLDSSPEAPANEPVQPAPWDLDLAGSSVIAVANGAQPPSRRDNGRPQPAADNTRIGQLRSCRCD